jgi:peroxiredoxin Q/BCP|tara:strand:+ start:14772 stop:14966 length:195 start_codon:yes stop_codon:yes gene_type:complete
MKYLLRVLFWLIAKIERWNKTMITAGEQAPAFSFTNQDGATVSLNDFVGKYVLLWWYPKADTPG